MKEEERRSAIICRNWRVLKAGPGTPVRGDSGALDAGLGGGLPRGGMVEMFGPASSREDDAGAADGGAGSEPRRYRGLDRCRTRVGSGICRETRSGARAIFPCCGRNRRRGTRNCRRLAQSRAIDLLVIDSAAALVPEIELETPVGDRFPGCTPCAGLGTAKTGCDLRRRGRTPVSFRQPDSRVPNGAGKPYGDRWLAGLRSGSTPPCASR